MKKGGYWTSFFLTPTVICLLFDFDLYYNFNNIFLFALASIPINLLLAFLYTKDRRYSNIFINTLLLSLVGLGGILIVYTLFIIVALGGSGGR